eukprot:TRINITY_DN1654_c0_g1_i2.p1 TRINITY_DN1654_c0_g1~~TRINITY_DN1654_c0_g1_i2.p1  ORF type:complete len:156 (-),score=57.53 TRINITY_DN1654_c0_g1_i2:20-487(-)
MCIRDRVSHAQVQALRKENSRLSHQVESLMKALGKSDPMAAREMLRSRAARLGEEQDSESDLGRRSTVPSLFHKIPTTKGLSISARSAKLTKGKKSTEKSTKKKSTKKSTKKKSTKKTVTVSYTHLRAHETVLDLVCRLLLEKKKKTTNTFIMSI